MELRSKAVGDEREYRRLKRLELAKRVKVNLWASSPSPPPSSELLAASGEANAQANANGKGKRVEEEENKREREEEEAAKGIEAQEKEQAVKLKEKKKEEESSSESGSDEEEAQEELKRFKAFLDKVSFKLLQAQRRKKNHVCVSLFLFLKTDSDIPNTHSYRRRENSSWLSRRDLRKSLGLLAPRCPQKRSMLLQERTGRTCFLERETQWLLTFRVGRGSLVVVRLACPLIRSPATRTWVTS